VDPTELSYDAELDRAYLRVGLPQTDVATKRVLIDDDDLPGRIAVDLDVNGRILGFELIRGSRSLPLAVLKDLR